jgi:hypothetical protein
MNVVLLLVAMGVIGIGVGLVVHYMIIQIKPGPVRIMAIDPMGGPPDYVKGSRRTGSVEATVHGRSVRIPLSEGIGFPWRGGTLYVVDATSGVPYTFKALDKRTMPAHIDAYRIMGEAMSANHEQLQRTEPEGLMGAIAKAMPILTVLAIGLLVLILFGVGRMAGWW